MPSLGDTVCYLVLADVLAAARPEIELTWLADSAVANFVRAHPGIRRVLAVQVPPSRLLRVPTLKTWYKLWAIVRALLRMDIPHPFDFVIVPRGGVDPAFSAHAVWVLNLPKSFGYSHRVEPEHQDHNFGDCLLTDVLTRANELHESMRALALLEPAGLVPNVRAYWDDLKPMPGIKAMAAAQDVPALLARLNLDAAQPFIVLSPGAGVPKRMWPAAKFREIAVRVLHHTTLSVVVVGTKAEALLCHQIVEGLPEERALSCAGQLSLLELIALLSRATLFLGNDSGTGHLAGALGLPVVSLNVQAKHSDPRQMSAPEHARPVGPHVTVVQPDRFLSPCVVRCESSHLHCLDQITVDQVWSALTETLAKYAVPTS